MVRVLKSESVVWMRAAPQKCGLKMLGTAAAGNISQSMPEKTLSEVMKAINTNQKMMLDKAACRVENYSTVTVDIGVLEVFAGNGQVFPVSV